MAIQGYDLLIKIIPMKASKKTANVLFVCKAISGHYFPKHRETAKIEN